MSEKSEFCENCWHSTLTECGDLYCERHVEPVENIGYCDDYFRDLKLVNTCNACSIIINLQQKNEQLKEALKKCSPFSRRGLCEFCVLGKWEHTDDCEYLRLTGGAE